MSEEIRIPELQLLTIICDESLESHLSEEILESGAKGYSVTRVEGSGKSGTRDNLWGGENIKFEVVTTQEIVDKILNLLAKKYMDRYAMIAYHSQVRAMRPEHFI